MYSIGEFAKKIGITIQTLRDWDKSGKLKPTYRSKGNHRYYSENQLNEILDKKIIFDSNSSKDELVSHIIRIIHLLDIKDKIIKELEK